MFSIPELKYTGKQAFLRNFFFCVIAALILTIVTSDSSNGRNNHSQQNYDQNRSVVQNAIMNPIESIPDTPVDPRLLAMGASKSGAFSIILGPFSWVVRGISAGVSFLFLIIGILVSFLIMGPLEVGGRRFFLVNLYRKANLGEFLFSFKNGWSNAVLTLLVRDIKLLLWTLLFIIPGIIKSYEYRMIPYLLAENPGMSSEEAFRESKRLMDGAKLDTFVLDISFFGWHLLSAFTFGLVDLFWTNAYAGSTNAALYEHLKGIKSPERDYYVE